MKNCFLRLLQVSAFIFDLALLLFVSLYIFTGANMLESPEGARWTTLIVTCVISTFVAAVYSSFSGL